MGLHATRLLLAPIATTRMFVAVLTMASGILWGFHPQVTDAATVTAGGACHSITPSQASLMEWREEGIKNSSATDYWVLCPTQRSAGFGEKEFSLRVFNESDATLSLQCYFREIFDNRRLQAKSVEADLDSSGSESLSWVMTPQNANSVVNVACKLPNGLLIEGITSGSSGANGITGGSADDVYACQTSVVANYASSATRVTMKNGMELNNYSGRSWSTNQTHTVFKTLSGKWYSIYGTGLTRLDVIKEPETCFEPDYAEVVDRYTKSINGTNRLILVTSEDEFEMESDCKIDVGAQVVSLSYFGTYVWDLLTARECFR